MICPLLVEGRVHWWVCVSQEGPNMDSGVYPASAVERPMKAQEVILRAIDGRLKWYHAAEILGIPARQMRRWRWSARC